MKLSPYLVVLPFLYTPLVNAQTTNLSVIEQVRDQYYSKVCDICEEEKNPFLVNTYYNSNAFGKKLKKSDILFGKKITNPNSTLVRIISSIDDFKEEIRKNLNIHKGVSGYIHSNGKVGLTFKIHF